MQTGDGRKPGRYPKQNPHENGIPRHDDVHQCHNYRRNLGRRCNFADDARLNFIRLLRYRKDSDAHNNKDIPADDNDRDPAGHDFEDRQADKSGYEQQFVGDRIEVGTQDRSLIEISGYQPIQTITDTRDGKNQQCRTKEIL